MITDFLKGKQHETWLVAILIIGTALRFYNYSSFSLTGDELISLLMLRGRTFSEMINEGVRPDFHPAFSQALLFCWVKLFGITEASIRIPYVVAGILAILFAYLVASQWFNKTTALFVAASICFLQFPLIHSQIARPYSLGLCFSLMAAWFWTLVLFKPKPNLGLKILGYAISTALCMYTHYFSFFFAMIMAGSGLFFISKENYKHILLCAALVLLLFTPHFDISLGHLMIGGFGESGWLGAPNLHGNWFWQYLLHCFNDSGWLLCFFLSISLVVMVRNYKMVKLNKFHLLCILWFLTPFFVGYYYSIYSKPVLQKTCLLFSFPFLIMLLFSFVKDENWSVRKDIFMVLFIITGLFSTIVVQRFYQTNHFGVLKEIAQKSIQSLKQYGGQNVTKTINLGHPYFIDYYLERYDEQIEFIPYVSEPQLLKYENLGRQDLMKMIDIVDDASTDYFLYTWSSGFSPHEMTEIIQDKYPCIVERIYYFNAEFYLFNKETTGECIDHDPVFLSMNDFEKDNDDWANSYIGRTEHLGYDSTFGYQFTQEIEFGPTLQMKVKDLFNATDNIIHTSLWVLVDDAQIDANMVITLESKNRVYDWRGMNLSYFIKNAGEWAKCYHSWRFHQIRSKEDIIKIYVWNTNRASFVIDNFQVKIDEGNPVIYGKVDHSL